VRSADRLVGAPVKGTLIGLVVFALLLLLFAAWALHRSRRWVEKDRYRPGGPP
jgi:hypothetical protein